MVGIEPAYGLLGIIYGYVGTDERLLQSAHYSGICRGIVLRRTHYTRTEGGGAYQPIFSRGGEQKHFAHGVDFHPGGCLCRRCETNGCHRRSSRTYPTRLTGTLITGGHLRGLVLHLAFHFSAITFHLYQIPPSQLHARKAAG